VKPGAGQTVLRAERETLGAKLEATPAATGAVLLHPAALTRYEGQLARLQEVLAAGTAAGDIEAAAAIRDIVETEYVLILTTVGAC
jgi:hypothetical protein